MNKVIVIVFILITCIPSNAFSQDLRIHENSSFYLMSDYLLGCRSTGISNIAFNVKLQEYNRNKTAIMEFESRNEDLNKHLDQTIAIIKSIKIAKEQL